MRSFAPPDRNERDMMKKSGIGTASRLTRSLHRRAAAGAALLSLAGVPVLAEQPPARGDPTVGAALAKNWCGQCHLIGGAGTATDAAPTFVSIARDPSSTPERLRSFLAKPHRAMPALPVSGTEADDLIAYILQVAR